MRPKVHPLGFHVWMKARWFLDWSFKPPSGLVRVYSGRGGPETERAGEGRTGLTKPARETHHSAFLWMKRRDVCSVVDECF